MPIVFTVKEWNKSYVNCLSIAFNFEVISFLLNFLIFTVPTTCSRPSIEMVGFIIIFTVPTTCSRLSIEMVGFIYVCMYFSVFTPLTRPLYIISSNLACSSVSSV